MKNQIFLQTNLKSNFLIKGIKQYKEETVLIYYKSLTGKIGIKILKYL